MGLGPILFVVENRQHARIVFLLAEGVLHLRKLDIGIPQRFRVGFAPVGTQDIAAPGLQRPLVALFVSGDLEGEPSLFAGAAFCNLYVKQRGGPMFALQESANPALDLLSAADLARLLLFGQLA